METFLALAPEGEEPHSGLVEAHELEAQGLERSDTTSVKVVDGRTLLIEKDLSPPCTMSSMYPLITPLMYTSKEVISVTIAQSEISLCGGRPRKFQVGAPSGCPAFARSKYLVAAACQGARGSEDATVYFWRENGARFPFPEQIGRLEFVRATLNPVPNPGPISIARELNVSIIQAAGDHISELYTGVGSL